MNFDEFCSKVNGCFTGKTVGGTLGMKYEGSLDVHEVNYYNPIPDKMLPNDDLDLQVINLENIIRTGLPICRYNLGETWKYHMTDSVPDEYGAAINNHAMKLYAPLSGQFRNKFTSGMGAAIRSELWACLAPANPSLAVSFAREDACADHYGEGIYAEMFLSAVESMVFVENDIVKIVKDAVNFIPDGNRLKNALMDVSVWWDKIRDVLKVREKILEVYKVDNFTDVTINLSFIFLSLIACGGSFDKAICTAVSLGYDTDCTGATVGSIFGIMNPCGIDKKWTNPIGDELVLGHCVINMHQFGTIRDFCRKVIDTAICVQSFYGTGISLGEPSDYSFSVKPQSNWTDNFRIVSDWQEKAKESLVAVRPFLISVCYPDTISVLPEKQNEFALKLQNTSGKDIEGKISLCLPDGWTVSPKVLEFNMEKDKAVFLPFVIVPKNSSRRANLNILSMVLEELGISFEFKAGIPISAPWNVTNLATGEKSIFEATDVFFTVPKGAYSYRSGVYVVKKQARLLASGTRPFKLLLNGEEIINCKGNYYIPAFHRSGNCTKVVNLVNGRNEIEVQFEESNDGEFFMSFGSLYSCGEWINTVERAL